MRGRHIKRWEQELLARGRKAEKESKAVAEIQKNVVTDGDAAEMNYGPCVITTMPVSNATAAPYTEDVTTNEPDRDEDEWVVVGEIS